MRLQEPTAADAEPLFRRLPHLFPVVRLIDDHQYAARTERLDQLRRMVQRIFHTVPRDAGVDHRHAAGRCTRRKCVRMLDAEAEHLRVAHGKPGTVRGRPGPGRRHAHAVRACDDLAHRAAAPDQPEPGIGRQHDRAVASDLEQPQTRERSAVETPHDHLRDRGGHQEADGEQGKPQAERRRVVRLVLDHRTHNERRTTFCKSMCHAIGREMNISVTPWIKLDGIVKRSVSGSQSASLHAEIARFQSDGSVGSHLWERIYRTAAGIARTEFRFAATDAEDIGQEMALRAFRHLTVHGFNYSWIRAGTRFLCIDRLRTLKVQERATAGYGATFEIARKTAEPFPDLTPAIARLPQTCRDLIHHYYWDGMTWAEIDSLLNPGHRCSQYQMKKCLEALKAKIREHEHVAAASRSLF